MAISPGMKMMLVQKAAKRETSEYSADNGRRMIGFDRNENHERMRGGDYNSARGEYNGYEGGEYNRARNDYPRSEYNGYDRGEYAYAPGMQMQSRANMPYMPPIYPNMRAGNEYGDIYAHGSIYAPGAMNKPERNMHSRDRDFDHDASDHTHEPITEHKARKWVEKMTTGEKYKPEITEQMRASFCPDCDKWEFYVAMNAMYADYRKTAQEMGMDKADFYARHARDFIEDDDAAPGKVARYMETIPKK